MAKEKKSCFKTKPRSEEEMKDLLHRLNRIEGQVRGIKKMIEGNAYCPDTLVQVGAVTSALNSVGRILLLSHVDTCVWNELKAGKKEALDEIVAAFNKIAK